MIILYDLWWTLMKVDDHRWLRVIANRPPDRLFCTFGQKVNPTGQSGQFQDESGRAKIFDFLRDQRMDDLFVKHWKQLSSANKPLLKNIDLLSPGENFSISGHSTNFSWPIARWYKNFKVKTLRKAHKEKFPIFSTSMGVFIPKNRMLKITRARVIHCFFREIPRRTRKKFSPQYRYPQLTPPPTGHTSTSSMDEVLVKYTFVKQKCTFLKKRPQTPAPS